MEVNRKPAYFAMIPSEILENQELSDGAKLVYARISSLCGIEGYCYASNKYLSGLFKEKDERQVRRYIRELKEKNYVEVVIKNSNKRIIKLPKLSIPQRKTNEKIDIPDYNWLEDDQF